MIKHPERNYPDQAADTAKLPPLTLREKLRVARGISTIVFLIPILFTTTIDFFISGRITWSSYVIVSLVGILGITLSALFFPKRNGLVNLLTHLILIGVTLFLNRFTGIGHLWSLSLALPIITGSWIITQGIIKVSKLKKGNLLAASILVGIGLLCMVVDFSINKAFGVDRILGWSLIVLSAVTPTALLLLYLYSAKFRKSKFRRFMHL